MLNKSRSSTTGRSIALTILVCLFLVSGCGDHSITGAGSSGNDLKNSSADNSGNELSSSFIKLDLGISSKRVSVNDSRLIESNSGNSFNSIVPVTLTLEPGMSEELQNIQQSGIFALYLTADGDFTMTNSDGLSVTLKSVLMEKCSFIDLKVTNNFHRKITITGFLAGE